MDGIDFARLATDGQSLAMERGDDANSPGECIWALTINAADALKRWRPNAKGGSPLSYWPDTHSDAAERHSVEWVRALEGVKIETHVYIPPTPREIERIDIMTTLWRPAAFRHMVKSDPIIAVKALWLYAGGSPMRRVEALTGVKKDALIDRRKRFSRALGDTIKPHMRQCDVA